MLDKLKKFLVFLKENKEFKEYKNKHSNSYLCSGFVMYMDLSKANWQIDFYCPKDEKITSFVMEEGKLNVKEEGVFQKQKKKVEKLDLAEVKIDFDKVLEIVNKIKKKKCEHEKENKVILILQHFEGKAIWNVSYLTSSFNILNVKIEATSGKVVHENFESILGFKK